MVGSALKVGGILSYLPLQHHHGKKQESRKELEESAAVQSMGICYRSWIDRRAGLKDLRAEHTGQGDTWGWQCQLPIAITGLKEPEEEVYCNAYWRGIYLQIRSHGTSGTQLILHLTHIPSEAKHTAWGCWGPAAAEACFMGADSKSQLVYHRTVQSKQQFLY